MTPNAGILIIVVPFAVAISQHFLRHGFDMSRERKYREMAGSLCLGLLPFGIASLIWTAIGEPPMALNNWLLGVVGAAIGASALIYGGYVVHDWRVTPAAAQSGTEKNPAETTSTLPSGSATHGGGVLDLGVRGRYENNTIDGRGGVGMENRGVDTIVRGNKISGGSPTPGPQLEPDRQK